MSAKLTQEKNVLITGGTKGIGLATAKQFAKAGYHCIITYAWGSVDEDSIMSSFESDGLSKPYLKQADVSSIEDTKDLLNEVAKNYKTIDAFVSNVSFCNLVKNIDDYSEKGLLKSIEYSTWPMIEYPRQMKKILGKSPRYVIGLSSYGIDTVFTAYDFVAASKVVMEILSRYLNYRFFNEEIIYNIVRTRPILTDSLIATLGKNFKEFIEKFDIPGTQTSLDDVGKVILMLCSGLMDGVRGQTITVDNGFSFADGLVSLYNEMEKTA